MVLASSEQTGDVLIFGGHYMHRGRPMGKAGSELRRLSAPLSTEGTAEDGLLDRHLRREPASSRSTDCV